MCGIPMRAGAGFREPKPGSTTEAVASKRSGPRTSATARREKWRAGREMASRGSSRRGWPGSSC